MTHGSTVNYSGKLYKPHFYGVEKETGLIDMDKVEATAREVKPKLLICGASAYSRDWDYERFRAIADEVGALLLADISHPSGLIATGLLEDPMPHCHIVTSTTHKTLRGPRGGIIMMGQDFDNPWGRTTPKGTIRKMSALARQRCFPRHARRSIGTRHRSQGRGVWRMLGARIQKLHAASDQKRPSHGGSVCRARL